MKYSDIKEILASNDKKIVSKGLKKINKEIETAEHRVQVQYNRILTDESLLDELKPTIEGGISYIEFLQSCRVQVENHHFELNNTIVEYELYEMKEKLGLK